jgi:hypothetical protein
MTILQQRALAFANILQRFTVELQLWVLWRLVRTNNG